MKGKEDTGNNEGKQKVRQTGGKAGKTGKDGTANNEGKQQVRQVRNVAIQVR